MSLNWFNAKLTYDLIHILNFHTSIWLFSQLINQVESPEMKSRHKINDNLMIKILIELIVEFLTIGNLVFFKNTKYTRTWLVLGLTNVWKLLHFSEKHEVHNDCTNPKHCSSIYCCNDEVSFHRLKRKINFQIFVKKIFEYLFRSFEMFIYLLLLLGNTFSANLIPCCSCWCSVSYFNLLILSCSWTALKVANGTEAMIIFNCWFKQTDSKFIKCSDYIFLKCVAVSW